MKHLKYFENIKENEYGIIGFDAVYTIANERVKVLKYYRSDDWSIPKIDVQFLDGEILKINSNLISRKLTPEEIEKWEIDFEANKFNI